MPSGNEVAQLLNKRSLNQNELLKLRISKERLRKHSEIARRPVAGRNFKKDWHKKNCNEPRKTGPKRRNAKQTKLVVIEKPSNGEQLHKRKKRIERTNKPESIATDQHTIAGFYE